MRRLVILVAWLLVAYSTACTPAAEAPATGASGLGSGRALDERAVLIELADRKLFEPVIVQRLLHANPDLRAALATALGRIGDRRGAEPLQTLLSDPSAEVRREAAFNLGLLGVKSASTELLRAVVDDDGSTGRLAVEALGKLSVPLARVQAALAVLPSPIERQRRLLPSLYRFHELETLPVARTALAGQDAEIRRWAAYALARDPFPQALPDLRRLLSSRDALVRAWSARAIGKVGESGDLERLLPLLSDRAPGPVIEALRAGLALVSDRRAAPAAGWRQPLRRLMDAAAPGVRLTAIEASGAWLPDPALGGALALVVQSGEERDRELAVVALATGGDPRAPALVEEAASSASPSRRAAAAAAAAAGGHDRILLRLSRDPDADVRATAVGEILQAGEPAAAQVRQRALLDADPVVRALALDDLKSHPETSWPEIVTAMRGPGSDELIDVRISGIQALRARAAAEISDRQPVQEQLRNLVGDPEYLVRRAASSALEAMGAEAPSIDPVRTGKDLATYRQVVLRTRSRPEVLLSTARGDIRLRLDCPEAPLTCLNFLQLAGQGFFDGLTFHRVVPDFVVQGGDPRGDGWGGPGYTLRDEINRLRYDRGALGMALSGPDTGGSQFFITLSPQPHLDGRYTVFGHVVAGGAVLDRLIQGDAIRRVVVLPGEQKGAPTTE